MRRPGGALIVAAFLGVAAPQPATAASSLTKCAARLQFGGDQFWRDLRVRGVRCIDGAQVARRWIRRYGTNARGGRYVGRWSCRLEVLNAGENPYGRVTCKLGERRVRFYGIS